MMMQKHAIACTTVKAAMLKQPDLIRQTKCSTEVKRCTTVMFRPPLVTRTEMLESDTMYAVGVQITFGDRN